MTAAAAERDLPGTLDQARLCWNTAGDPGVEACRRALALGLAERRAALVQESLAVKLAGLDRFEEMVEVYREAARQRPQDAEAQFRLGRALLQALDRAAEAEPVLREAVRLRPADAAALLTLGTALHRLGRHGDAVAAFEEALRMDPALLDHRPAARAVLESARRGQGWPEDVKRGGRE